MDNPVNSDLWDQFSNTYQMLPNKSTRNSQRQRCSASSNGIKLTTNMTKRYHPAYHPRRTPNKMVVSAVVNRKSQINKAASQQNNNSDKHLLKLGSSCDLDLGVPQSATSCTTQTSLSHKNKFIPRHPRNHVNKNDRKDGKENSEPMSTFSPVKYYNNCRTPLIESRRKCSHKFYGVSDSFTTELLGGTKFQCTKRNTNHLSISKDCHDNNTDISELRSHVFNSLQQTSCDQNFKSCVMTSGDFLQTKRPENVSLNSDNHSRASSTLTSSGFSDFNEDEVNEDNYNNNNDDVKSLIIENKVNKEFVLNISKDVHNTDTQMRMSALELLTCHRNTPPLISVLSSSSISSENNSLSSSNSNQSNLTISHNFDSSTVSFCEVEDINEIEEDSCYEESEIEITDIDSDPYSENENCNITENSSQHIYCSGPVGENSAIISSEENDSDDVETEITNDSHEDDTESSFLNDSEE